MGDWDFLPSNEPREGWPYWCPRCGNVGLAVSEEPECAGPRKGPSHDWTAMQVLDQSQTGLAEDLKVR